ncbi:bifunctional pyr operon transcriptional regulator/uracil phosphoribosyltransferase PyrR [Methylocaldum sp. GT1TLB]|uniref:bifunctional pyr operon transcriptional regulator/uracil phosphoribosyltransferase PyrR n=1 Tax=Methylocaldum sp. GT1TLB TaxID=3438965 RepID=UPI003DA1347D
MFDTALRVDLLLDRLEASLREEMARREFSDPAMIGIHTGGAWIADRLRARLGLAEPLGLLNISFYRDDFSQTGIHPQVKPSVLPFRVEGRNILLIDDVFYTGRTVRAALNEIFDYGRPAQVLLGVLIERNGRQIPIRPDCIGHKITLAADQRITLSGPSPLELRIHSVSPQS